MREGLIDDMEGILEDLAEWVLKLKQGQARKPDADWAVRWVKAFIVLVDEVVKHDGKNSTK